MNPRPRPTSVTVFAVLNMVFGGLGLLGTLFSLSMRGFADQATTRVFEEHAFLSVWQDVSVFLGVVVSGALVAMGIALLGLKPWARKACVAYGVYGVLMSLVGLVVSWAVMRPALKAAQGDMEMGGFVVAGSMVGATIGALFGMAYPLVLGIFMARKKMREVFEPEKSERASAFD